MAILRGDLRRAADLLGAAERLCGDAGVVIRPGVVAIHDRTVASVLAGLGEQAYAAEPPRRAVAHARSEVNESRPRIISNEWSAGLA